MLTNLLIDRTFEQANHTDIDPSFAQLLTLVTHDLSLMVTDPNLESPLACKLFKALAL